MVLTASPQSAAASCAPAGRSNIPYGGFAGTQANVTGVRDVFSSIREYSPYVTTSPTSEVTQWVMLNNGSTRWAQVGWWQTPTARYSFEQHTDNSGGVYTNWYAANGNTYNSYEVSFNPTTHVYGFYRNGSLLSSSTQQWSPATYQLYGEVHRQTDQMPGGTSSHSTFRNSTYNTTTSVTSSAGTNNSSYYGASYVSSGAYDIWDKGCSS